MRTFALVRVLLLAPVLAAPASLPRFVPLDVAAAEGCCSSCPAADDASCNPCAPDREDRPTTGDQCACCGCGLGVLAGVFSLPAPQPVATRPVAPPSAPPSPVRAPTPPPPKIAG